MDKKVNTLIAKGYLDVSKDDGKIVISFQSHTDDGDVQNKIVLLLPQADYLIKDVVKAVWETELEREGKRNGNN